MAAQYIFERHEKKYRLAPKQYRALLRDLGEHMRIDTYGKHTICSLYYDTPDFRCARDKEEGKTFREKLRLRSYGVPRATDTVYLELKKKYRGITYKRRMPLLYGQAAGCIQGRALPGSDAQIAGEIRWYMEHYGVEPKALICYDRIALYCPDAPDPRVTFDSNIRWRASALDPGRGDWGQPLITDGSIMMEIKAAQAYPLWLVDLLARHQVLPCSFSKYTGVCENILTEESCHHVG